jgi:hypothetical protein
MELHHLSLPKLISYFCAPPKSNSPLGSSLKVQPRTGPEALDDYLVAIDFVTAVQDERQARSVERYVADLLIDYLSALLRFCSDLTPPVRFSDRTENELQSILEGTGSDRGTPVK